MIFKAHIKLFFILAALSISLASCEKTKGEMTVIKDCTGKYLRFNGLDYPICNWEVVSNIESGTIVDAAFRKIGNGKCEAKEGYYCMMVHPYQIGDWIKVTKIK